ncbi:uncharacterized protein PAC_20161 [Phialocephala subalpina]|uniref:Uncharacterized protein n=1 Tax=Phialocephala subalpina TaxID=576137 RepID=A0A1L7XZ51_9HELO|nr:uncharacterized protein PAC_20161 [Phialocephala subalpina]
MTQSTLPCRSQDRRRAGGKTTSTRRRASRIWNRGTPHQELRVNPHLLLPGLEQLNGDHAKNEEMSGLQDLEKTAAGSSSIYRSMPAKKNIRSFEHGWQGFTVPEDLSRALEDIEGLAGQAYDSNDLSIAELAFIELIEWYDDLGLEFQQLREGLLMKVGGIFEATEWKLPAEKYSLKIFDYLPMAPSDTKTPFHHAIRNFKKKVPVEKRREANTTMVSSVHQGRRGRCRHD